jgi:hypothetical protein
MHGSKPHTYKKFPLQKKISRRSAAGIFYLMTAIFSGRGEGNMAEGKTFYMEEEFAGLDFNSKRLEKRFKRTMKTLAKQPDESIWGCIAVTPDGLVRGVLDQTHYNRPQAKDDTMTAEVKKNRPIEEKESNRWLVMLKSYRSVA